MENNRRCVVTYDNIKKDEALRLVISPDGELVFDVEQSLPKRGFWIKADADIIAELIQKPKLLRASEKFVIADDFLLTIENMLVQSIQKKIGLAKKASLMQFGFEKITLWHKDKKAFLYLFAKEASKAEADRLLRRLNVSNTASCLTSAEQGYALGRDSIVHMVFVQSKLTERIRQQADKLSKIRA